MDGDLNFIWKAIVIVLGGILILRVAGRKTISQLTVAQTVMMVAVGSLIIQPVNNKNIWITMVITFLMVLTLLLIEYIVLKSDKMESFFYGKSIIVIDNGILNEQNLKKLRLTVDMLEVRLRQQGVQKVSDVKWATIESNGQLGYLLKEEKQNATKEDIQKLISLLEGKTPITEQSISSEDIFKEIKNNKHQKRPPRQMD